MSRMVALWLGGALVAVPVQAPAHGPAPAPLQVLSPSGQLGGFQGDAARPGMIRTSIGLAAANADGTYTYRCPSQYGQRATALASVTADHTLTVAVSGGELFASSDLGCSTVPVSLPDGVTGYASDVQVWRGDAYVLVRESDRGTLIRISSQAGAGPSASVVREFDTLVPDSALPFEFADGRGGLLVSGARPAPAVWVGWASVGAKELTWTAIGGLPAGALQRLDVRAVSEAGDELWVATGETSGRRLWWGRATNGVLESSTQWQAADGGAAVLFGPVSVPQAGTQKPMWLATFDGVAKVAEVAAASMPPWTGASVVPWTCLQRVEGVTYACTLVRMLALTEVSSETSALEVASRPIWGLQQLGPPDTSCLETAADITACDLDWLHFGGEAGLVGRTPKADPSALFEPGPSDPAPEAGPEPAEADMTADPGATLVVSGGCNGGIPLGSLGLTLLALASLFTTSRRLKTISREGGGREREIRE